MRAKTCCFTGHRTLPADSNRILQNLEAAIRSVIGKGVCYFGYGGALGFDLLAAQTVLRLKQEFPQIHLILIAPCKEQTKQWKPEEIALYESVKRLCSKTVCLSEHYYSGCMHTRNRHLIDHSAYCICYQTQERGGTFYTTRYARKQGVQLVSVA